MDHAPAQTNLGKNIFFEETKKSGDSLNRHVMNSGVMYENGTDGPQDFRKAKALYEMAAERGNVTALYNLALIYEQGKGSIPRDSRKAIELWTRAAKKGDSLSNIQLGYMNEHGIGISAPDPVKAAEWY